MTATAAREAVFEFIPEFSIEGYKTVTVEKTSVEVTEEEYQHELEQLRESPLSSSRWRKTGAEGWRLGADHLKGLIDGEPEAAPVAGEDTLVEIGAKTLWRLSPKLCAAPNPARTEGRGHLSGRLCRAQAAGKTVSYRSK